MSPSPGAYRIDPNEGIVYIAGREIATLDEWTAFIDEILADPSYRVGFSLISDRRDQHQVPPPGYARALAEKLRERAGKLSGCRWAMVVNSTVAYGLGRMIELTVESDGIDMRLFTDYEAAMAWIRAGKRGV